MLLHSDGFDSHAAAATLSDGDPRWTGQSGVTVTAAVGKFAGNSLRRAAATLGWASFVNAGTQKGFAFYAKPVAAFGGAAEASLLETGAGLKLLTVDNTGVLKAYDGATTLRATSAAAALVSPSFFWIEVDYLSAGITVRVNGVIVATYVGAYTTPGSAFRLGGAAPANTPIFDFDDLVTWDDSGSFFNTFGLTPRRIQLLRPTANGSVNQWTPASGSNWAAVDAASWAGGVGVTATVAGQKDLYQLSDLAVNPASINAVTIKTRQLNTGDNPAQLQHVLRDASNTEVASLAQPVSSVAAGPLVSNFYVDPNGQPWTATSVNALQAGQTSSN